MSRIHESTGWCAATATLGDWIQVDLGQTRIITALVTKGSGNWVHWVTVYSLSVSSDGINWDIVPSPASVSQGNGGDTFLGNTDTDTEVRNAFVRPFGARFVRFTIVEIYRWGMIRWSIEGCPLE